MNTAAYDKGLPCLNPNCKSHGRPHPNCKCYGLAHGGEVEHFCSEAREHNHDCEYFSPGGMIDPAQVIPDQESIDPSQVQIDEEIPHDQVKLDSDKYGSTEQQVKTGLEGAAEGLAGPVAPWVETHLMGVSPEDIKGRAEANPYIHGGAKASALVGGLLTGVGEAGLIAKGAGALSEAANLGKVGSMALKGIIEGASFEGADEISKSILGRPGSDPEASTGAALLHVGAAGLMGGLTGGVFGLGDKMIGKGLQSLENQKVVDTAQNLLSKLGENGNPLDKLGLTQAAETTIKSGILSTVGTISSSTGLPPGIVLSSIEKAIEKPFEKLTGKLNNYATDGIIHCLLSNETSGIPNVIHYAKNILMGAKKANQAVSSLFSLGASKIAPEVSDKAKESLREFIEKGQVDQQMQNSMNSQGAFASGGMVSSTVDHFSRAFPEQNTLLNTAKGRISGYLNSIRPTPNQMKLPFDKPNPEKQKHRDYEKALDIAVNPMVVLDHVNKGDLTPDHMKHFTSMYPEVHRYLSKEITKKIVDSQLNEEMPIYTKRQAMSLFLGAALDSTFTPSAISTIQGMYQIKGQAAQQQAPQDKPKKSSSTLSKLAPSAMTNEQARIGRQQNLKS